MQYGQRGGVDCFPIAATYARSAMLLRALLPGLMLVAAATTAATAVQAGNIEVRFVHPDQYTDAVFDTREPDRARREIERHLTQLAERSLPASDRLVVDIVDIDLAGRFSMRPGHFNDVRVLTNVTWPTIRLHYRWLRGDTVVREADEAVSDLAYMTRGNRYFSSDSFRYEKQMLDDWFRKTFGPPAKTRKR